MLITPESIGNSVNDWVPGQARNDRMRLDIKWIPACVEMAEGVDLWVCSLGIFALSIYLPFLYDEL